LQTFDTIFDYCTEIVLLLFSVVHKPWLSGSFIHGGTHSI